VILLSRIDFGQSKNWTGKCKARGIDIVFCDGCIQKYAEDVVPSRQKSRFVSQIINQLGNDRIGIAYAGSAFRSCPPTDYKMFLQSMNTEMVSLKERLRSIKLSPPILMIRAKRGY
jgi:hypothetical protein